MEIGRIDLGPRHLLVGAASKPVADDVSIELEKLTKRVSDLEECLTNFSIVVVALTRQVTEMAQYLVGEMEPEAVDKTALN